MVQTIGAPLACGPCRQIAPAAALLAAPAIIRISSGSEISEFSWRSGGVVMKQQLKLAGLAVLLSVAAGQAIAQEKLKIGVIVTLSGPAAVLGQQARDGFTLAVKDLGLSLIHISEPT